MNEYNEKITNNVVEIFSDVIAQLTNTMTNKDLILKDSVGGDRSLLGMKITKVKFLGKEYYLKANRHLLVIVLKYLVEKDMIDLIEELPLKNINTNKRCLINYRPFHADDYKMKDLIYLNTEGGCLYLETKLDTPTIHDACYNLMRRYGITKGSLEVHYSDKKIKVPVKYKKKVRRNGYCLINDDNFKLNDKQAA
ncbi:hypothetical protein [Maribellus mangrovi]|uniref:hypothetical protein n=1 Tax=Maribellus mangrovi TaxID=3133146 RepID=UPI0030EB144D